MFQCLSLGFWVCFVVFWKGYSGFWGVCCVGVLSGLVWVFDRGFISFLGFGFLVGFDWVGSVLRHLFLIYSVCTRGVLCCYL
jgi:hypothetical protein